MRKAVLLQNDTQEPNSDLLNPTFIRRFVLVRKL